jgi:hypothetical protein
MSTVVQLGGCNDIVVLIVGLDSHQKIVIRW